MSRHSDIETDHSIYALLGLIMIPVCIVTLWVLLAFHTRHSSCVALPNGLLLGHAAVFDLSKPALRPIIVPKFPDGRPLISDKLWSIYFTQTSAYGTTRAMHDKSDFAWTNEAGLIFKSENTVGYNSIVRTSGPANWDLGVGAYGPSIIFQKLQNHTGFNLAKCRTRLITW